MIEPLRPKFVQKLKNESYICKKCGNAFTPAQNEVWAFKKIDLMKVKMPVVRTGRGGFIVTLI